MIASENTSVLAKVIARMMIKFAVSLLIDYSMSAMPIMGWCSIVISAEFPM